MVMKKFKRVISCGRFQQVIRGETTLCMGRGNVFWKVNVVSSYGRLWEFLGKCAKLQDVTSC